MKPGGDCELVGVNLHRYGNSGPPEVYEKNKMMATSMYQVFTELVCEFLFDMLFLSMDTHFGIFYLQLSHRGIVSLFELSLP